MVSGAPDSEMRQVLQILGFLEYNSVPRMKDVVKMFRKMALKMHPDKPGGSTEQFQVLQEAFLKVGTHIENQSRKNQRRMEEDEDAEENMAKNIFKHFYLSDKFKRSKKSFLLSNKSETDPFLMSCSEIRKYLRCDSSSGMMSLGYQRYFSVSSRKKKKK